MGPGGCEAATEEEFGLGNAGCGAGALSGGIKGGLGTASEVLDSGITVGRHCGGQLPGLGDRSLNRTALEIGLELDGEFGPAGKKAVRLPAPPGPREAGNTTIGVVATDAALTKAQAQKVAQMAQDGLARAIRPAHTMFDGDTIFCLATGTKELPGAEGFFTAPQAPALTEIGRAAADCFSRAVIRGLLAAESLGSMSAFADLKAR